MWKKNKTRQMIAAAIVFVLIGAMVVTFILSALMGAAS